MKTKTLAVGGLLVSAAVALSTVGAATGAVAYPICVAASASGAVNGGVPMTCLQYTNQVNCQDVTFTSPVQNVRVYECIPHP